MPFSVLSVFRGTIIIEAEAGAFISFDFKIEPAHTPGASLGGHSGMLRLHIAGHAASAIEILPFRKTPNYPVLLPTPSECIGARRTLAMQRGGVKVDGDFFGYEMFYL